MKKKKKKKTTTKKEEEKSDLISCPTGVIPLGLAEWLIYLQGWVILPPSSSILLFSLLQPTKGKNR